METTEPSMFILSVDTSLLNTSIGNRTNVTRSLLYLYRARYSTMVLFVLSLYLVFMLLLYQIKLSRQRKFNVNFLVLISAFMTLLNCTSQLCEMWIGIISCKLYHLVDAMTFAIGTALVYTVIWARQRSLYSDPRLAKTVKRGTSLLSTVVIVAFYVTFLIPLICFAKTYTILPITKYGCVIFWEGDSVETIVLPVLITNGVGVVFFQTVLFILIMYPLFQQDRARDVMSRGKPYYLYCLRLDTDIHRLLLRLGISSLLCMLSAILSCILIGLSIVEVIHVYWSNFIAADMIIFTVATVLTFANWRQRLFPLIYWKDSRIAHEPSESRRRSSQKVLLSSKKSISSQV